MPLLTSPHAIENFLRKNQTAYRLFFFKENQRTEKIIQLAMRYGVPIKRVEKETLKAMGAFHCALEIPEEQFRGGQNWFKQELDKINKKKSATILILDSITDPHNLGAILRSCALFSVDLVLYPQRRSAKGDTDTVHRISTGAANLVQHGEVSNIIQCIEHLKKAGCWVYGTDMKGTPLHEETTLPQKIVILIGSEGHGLGALIRKSCDGMLAIATSGKIDSLNASVACGIVLYHRYTSLIQTNHSK